MYTYSVVIATLNRKNDLKIAIESILNQKIKPLEIIVIDQSDNNDTGDLIINYSKNNKKIKFIYEKINVKSLTKARNTGIEIASGDIITFFDDDIELFKNYFEELNKFYEKNNAVLVGGNIINQEINKEPILSRILKTIFLLSRWEQNKFIVQNSFNPIIGHPLSKTVNGEWSTGAALSVKREIAEKFKFDESLIKYALAEDMDFSYRIFKQYPGKIFISHTAKLNHYHSPSGRLPSRELIFMNAVHKRYLFEKNVSKNFKSYYQFYLSRIGRIFLQLLLSIKHFNIKYLKVVMNMVKAEIFVKKNMKYIKNFNLEFFHRYIEKINKKSI